mgnify:CR=1 FL=1
MKIIPKVVLLFLLVAALPSGDALAHDGEPHPGSDVWSAWNLSPTLLLSFAAAAAVYLKGVKDLWDRSGTGIAITRRQVGAFLGGLFALALALLSPLDALAGVSLSWHMVQHLLLILVAAPLLILSNPLFGFLWAAPKGPLKALGRWWNRRSGLKQALRLLFHPLSVWVLYAVALWVWHAPAFYQAALRNETVHVLEHLSFLLAALIFWWTVLPGRRPGHFAGYATSVFLLFTTALQGGLLGALLAFSGEVWYPVYQETGFLASITPLEDQNLAGLVMWVPSSLVYLAFALALLARLLNLDEAGEAGRIPDGSTL